MLVGCEEAVEEEEEVNVFAGDWFTWLSVDEGVQGT